MLLTTGANCAGVPFEVHVLGNDVDADLDAFIANEDVRAGDELSHIVLVLVAEGAAENLAAVFLLPLRLVRREHGVPLCPHIVDRIPRRSFASLTTGLVGLPLAERLDHAEAPAELLNVSFLAE